MGFPNELGFEELTNLLTDHGVPFRVEPAVFLNNGLMSRVNIKPVDMIDRSILGMSSWDQANTSLYSLRKSTSQS